MEYSNLHCAVFIFVYFVIFCLFILLLCVCGFDNATNRRYANTNNTDIFTKATHNHHLNVVSPISIVDFPTSSQLALSLGFVFFFFFFLFIAFPFALSSSSWLSMRKDPVIHTHKTKNNNNNIIMLDEIVCGTHGRRFCWLFCSRFRSGVKCGTFSFGFLFFVVFVVRPMGRLLLQLSWYCCLWRTPSNSRAILNA